VNIRYVLYPRTKKQRAEIKEKLAVALSHEEYPGSKKFTDVLVKALDYYNKNFVRRP